MFDRDTSRIRYLFRQNQWAPLASFDPGLSLHLMVPKSEFTNFIVNPFVPNFVGTHPYRVFSYLRSGVPSTFVERNSNS